MLSCYGSFSMFASADIYACRYLEVKEKANVEAAKDQSEYIFVDEGDVVSGAGEVEQAKQQKCVVM